MGRTEFLETLGAQLAGQMQDGKASLHVRYYRDYIEEQMRKGRTEEEIMAELGDPRLIAKTLLDTDPEAGQAIFESGQGYAGEDYGNSGYGRTDDGNADYGYTDYGEAGYGREQQGHGKHRTYHLDLTTWYGKLIVLAVAALVIGLLIFVIGTILPVIIVAGLILWLISWIRRRM